MFCGQKKRKHDIHPQCLHEDLNIEIGIILLNKNAKFEYFAKLFHNLILQYRKAFVSIRNEKQLGSFIIVRVKMNHS